MPVLNVTTLLTEHPLSRYVHVYSVYVYIYISHCRLPAGARRPAWGICVCMYVCLFAAEHNMDGNKYTHMFIIYVHTHPNSPKPVPPSAAACVYVYVSTLTYISVHLPCTTVHHNAFTLHCGTYIAVQYRTSNYIYIPLQYCTSP